jgi:UDP-N-acetylmuramate--alanine ligase
VSVGRARQDDVHRHARDGSACTRNGADVRERGVIADLGVSSGTGGDELFVIEADESDGTFLLYDTSVALITNVDPDHLDHWESRDAFYDGFVRFGDAAREAVVISADDSGARRVAAALRHERIVTFGRMPPPTSV